MQMMPKRHLFATTHFKKRRPLFRCCVLVLLCAIGLIGVLSCNQPVFDTRVDYTDTASELKELHPLGTVTLASPIDQLLTFQVKDEVAYIAHFNGLQNGGDSYIEIVDVQSATRPFQQTSLPAAATKIECMAVSDRYLVVAMQPFTENALLRDIEVRIYDIAHHRSPKLLTTKRLPYYHCQALHMIQDNVYLAAYDGVAIFDLPSISTVQLAPKQDIQHNPYNER